MEEQRLTIIEKLAGIEIPAGINASVKGESDRLAMAPVPAQINVKARKADVPAAVAGTVSTMAGAMAAPMTGIVSVVMPRAVSAMTGTVSATMPRAVSTMARAMTAPVTGTVSAAMTRAVAAAMAGVTVRITSLQASRSKDSETGSDSQKGEEIFHDESKLVVCFDSLPRSGGVSSSDAGHLWSIRVQRTFFGPRKTTGM